MPCRDARKVFVDEGVERDLGPFQGGQDIPERIVEIEGDAVERPAVDAPGRCHQGGEAGIETGLYPWRSAQSQFRPFPGHPSELEPTASVEEQPVGAQQRLLLGCATASPALAYASPAVDDPVPGQRTLLRDRGHRVAHHARGAAALDAGELPVGGDLAGGNLRDQRVDPLVGARAAELRMLRFLLAPQPGEERRARRETSGRSPRRRGRAPARAPHGDAAARDRGRRPPARGRGESAPGIPRARRASHRRGGSPARV